MADQQNKIEIQALQLVQAAIKRDEELRKQYEMSQKFRFIPERLSSILQQLEEALKNVAETTDQKKQSGGYLPQEDEVLVYVYLYNVHGVVLSNWQNLLTPKVFYEYSVNRPIYLEKAYIEKLVSSKNNKAQHAYLTVVIKAAHIVKTDTESKDALGNPLIKIKEGALVFDKLLCFTCNDEDYILNDKGELLKKS